MSLGLCPNWKIGRQDYWNKRLGYGRDGKIYLDYQSPQETCDIIQSSIKIGAFPDWCFLANSTTVKLLQIPRAYHTYEKAFVKTEIIFNQMPDRSQTLIVWRRVGFLLYSCGFIAKHLFVFTLWCHNIMHTIIGAPISISASLSGHVIFRVTH
jgi:hypothetical protein